MNGRIYDPTLGRFLQADSHIQAPMNSQSYNRYSYVLNNPLSYTDPSGYFFKKLFKFVKKHWRTIVSIAIAVYLPGVSWVAELGSVGAGALTGFVSGAVATGSLKGALIGAFTGGMFGELHHMAKGFGKVIAHGTVGGIGSVLSGGKFGHGFLSAGFTQAAGSIKGMFVDGATKFADRAANAMKAAVIGGTASTLSGGKFANGAITGAFSRLLNDDYRAPDEKDPASFTEGQSPDKFLEENLQSGEFEAKFEISAGPVSTDGKEISLSLPKVAGPDVSVNDSGVVKMAGALNVDLDDVQVGAEVYIDLQGNTGTGASAQVGPVKGAVGYKYPLYENIQNTGRAMAEFFRNLSKSPTGN